MAEMLVPRKRGPYRTGVRRREQLVESASRVFAEYGFAGGSIRTIAAGVGVTSATLIQHFGSKEGLLEAVLENWEQQQEAFAPTSAKGLAYIRATRGYIQYHLQHRGLIELFITLAAEATSPSHPAHEFMVNRYKRSLTVLAEKFREACDAGEVAPMTDRQIEFETRQMFAMLDGLELQWLLDPTVNMAEMYQNYLEEMIRRLQPRDARCEGQAARSLED